ncbi:MAG: tetratricopeptide repeat protein, partial [Desulfatirhabdiaceae bacterium]
HTAFWLIILLVGIIYANSTDGAWHFDDYPNIVWNTRLHLSDLYPQSILQTFYTPTLGNPRADGDLYRPVAGLTFGLNWFWGQERVFGYHAVNIIIHGMNALLIYAIILLLLKHACTPGFSRYADHAKSIALLSAVLWAVHPIQTQAVTYIVQRMTSLAALFCLVSIYAYIRARIATSTSRKMVFFGLCVLSFVLAVGSKENGAILPAGLLLVEILFFQTRPEQTSRIRFWFLLAVAFSAVLICAWFFLNGNPLSILDGYARRPFTMWERVLTQFRVLVMYLGQIVYPVESRLSFMHDVAISRSIVDPVTTLASLLLIVSLVGASLWKWKRWTAWSFAILFYFLMHGIESGIVPLELVYEHRNYLPSAFLFFPVSTGIFRLLQYADGRSSILKPVISLSVAALIMAMGIGTTTRNMVYQTEKSFWEDAIVKAPGMGRSYHNLAADHYEKIGMPDKAMQLYEMALQGKDLVLEHRAFTYNNMGNLYSKKKNYEQAIQLYQAARSIDPSDSTTNFNLAVAYLGSGNSNMALQVADRLLEAHPNNAEYLCLKGFIRLKYHPDETASTTFRKALKHNPFHVNSLFYLGMALSREEKYAISEQFVKKAIRLAPNEIWVHFGLIEILARSGNQNDLDMCLTRLLGAFSTGRILAALNDLKVDALSPPLDHALIAKKCEERLIRLAGKMGER